MLGEAGLRVAESLKLYYEVTKPRVWYLLAFTAFGGFMAASTPPINWLRALHTVAAVSLAAAGSETLANYLERGLDAEMERTRRRPLPSGRLKPPRNALIYGFILTVSGVLLSAFLNLLALTFILIGVLDYLVVYVMLSKRRTPLNVILGSAAGGAPALVGYTSAAGILTSEAWILAAIVVLWIPSHIWSLALRYREDYQRAGVPMLPVVLDEEKAIRCISSTAILLTAFSIAVYFLNIVKYGLLYLSVVTVTGGILLYLSLLLMIRPSKKVAWILFKFTSPHLAAIFTAIILETLF